jgi:hypothetical protein
MAFFIWRLAEMACFEVGLLVSKVEAAGDEVPCDALHVDCAATAQTQPACTSSSFVLCF